jgi:hypothetical protein
MLNFFQKFDKMKINLIYAKSAQVLQYENIQLNYSIVH